MPVRRQRHTSAAPPPRQPPHGSGAWKLPRQNARPDRGVRLARHARVATAGSGRRCGPTADGVSTFQWQGCLTRHESRAGAGTPLSRRVPTHFMGTPSRAQRSEQGGVPAEGPKGGPGAWWNRSFRSWRARGAGRGRRGVSSTQDVRTTITERREQGSTHASPPHPHADMRAMSPCSAGASSSSRRSAWARP